MSELRTKKLSKKEKENLKALISKLGSLKGISPFTDFHLLLLKAINPMNASQSDRDTIESMLWTYEAYL